MTINANLKTHGLFAFAIGLGGLAIGLTPGCARVAACESFDTCAVAGETGGDTGDDTGDDSGLPDLPEDTWDPPLSVNKDIDILFVIDNSGSMGEEQAILASSLAPFIDVLEQPGIAANYRIGFTTTDNGNPWCPVGATTPESGKLVLSSCKTRIGDFLFGDSVDVSDLACNDICNLDAADLEILPTTTDVDSQPKPRPWLERIEGWKNIPDATGTAEAFACFAPQGVNGCGFESPLESMYLALGRAQSTDEASFGFIRPHAILAVIFLTDEVDCSYNTDWASIFDAEGNKEFWSDPMAGSPTSAICWNAGVECSGDPSSYADCTSVNKDVNGNLDVADPEAVLHPVDRYIDLLEGIELQKQQLNDQQEVIVAVIGGVTSSGEPFYAEVGDSDPQFQANFGIGPGCVAPNPLDPNAPIRAVPPVRLRELSQAFTPDNMFSICEPDYTPALMEILNRIETQIQPACYSSCVEDTDPATEVVDPQCTLEQNPPGQGRLDIVPVSECLRDAKGYVIDVQTSTYAMPNAAANVCYAMLVDTGGQTADPSDDISAVCSDDHGNLEFKLARRPGFPAIGGTQITADCVGAEVPEVTCG